MIDQEFLTVKHIPLIFSVLTVLITEELTSYSYTFTLHCSPYIKWLNLRAEGHIKGKLVLWKVEVLLF